MLLIRALRIFGAGVAMVGALGLACWIAPGKALSAITPDGASVAERGIAYGEGPRRMLDVYAPTDATRAPVVVFFYGGGWAEGDRALYEGLGNAMTARGIVAVIPDYRIYPEVGFPDFLQDAVAATRWARENAPRFGGDPARMVLMGHSAGAYIAAMLVLDGQWLKAEGLDPKTHVAGWIGLSGPYDFLPLTKRKLIEIFGGANRPETQPINFVAAGSPPALLASGDRDTKVPPANPANLYARIRNNDGHVEEIIYPGVGHLGIILAFAGPLQLWTPVAHDTAQFIRSVPPTH